jgi:hypothetical protein
MRVPSGADVNADVDAADDEDVARAEADETAASSLRERREDAGGARRRAA